MLINGCATSCPVHGRLHVREQALQPQSSHSMGSSQPKSHSAMPRQYSYLPGAEQPMNRSSDTQGRNSHQHLRNSGHPSSPQTIAKAHSRGNGNGTPKTYENHYDLILKHASTYTPGQGQNIPARGSAGVTLANPTNTYNIANQPTLFFKGQAATYKVAESPQKGIVAFGSTPGHPQKNNLQQPIHYLKPKKHSYMIVGSGQLQQVATK